MSKKMTLEEAEAVLSKIDSTKRIVDDDGKIAAALKVYMAAHRKGTPNMIRGEHGEGDGMLLPTPEIVRGERGPMGEQGPMGERGPMGDSEHRKGTPNVVKGEHREGAIGVRGERGPRGERGELGERASTPKKMTKEEACRILAEADAITTRDEDGAIVLGGKGPTLEEIVEATETLEEEGGASKKKMTREEALMILAEADAITTRDEDGAIVLGGKGPTLEEIVEATETLEEEGKGKASKKEMTVEEARKIKEALYASTRIDPSDGLVISTGNGPSVDEVAEAERVLKEAEFAKRMSVQEAKDVLRRDERHTDADGLPDGKGPAFERVLHAKAVLYRTMDTELERIISGEIRPSQVEALSPSLAYDVLRQHAAEERKKGFWERIFSKKEKPFYWENPMEWEDVKFESPRGQILFSHRINLEYLTPDQEKQVRAGLKKRGINFTERQATRTSGSIRQGDRTLRISDKESIEKLRSTVFHWAEGRYSKPVSMSVEEYNAMQEKMAQKEPPVTPQKPRTPTPEPERPFDWQDPMCWQDVKFKAGNEMIFSHRVRLEGLTPEQEKDMKEGLAVHHINYEERPASFDDGKIKKGDRTLRIKDKDSIRQLRSMVFHWAEGRYSKPVSMPMAEYVTREFAKAALDQKKADQK